MKKKTYIQPAVEAAAVELTTMIMVVSGNIDNGGGGGGSIDPD